ncbi:hypothetical protein D9619_010940 [Psilocybe cf. subviscida]|uniref:EF-hand domain-containing protein n=1 Tax=Psilocybe cf. subviscida TaxID=2480587 RepID=A0A8H5B910_9AGAR|nr:hypothetical protein D9619_010940 [Psilocybe cf. subviscida]
MDDEGHAQKLLKLETNQEETWVALRQFYAKNQASIERSRSLNVGQGQFQDELEQVLEASQVLLDGLVALANVHPVFGVAIFAFHGIIKLDITRRENNRKVLAVKLQMQSMMSAMFQMCELTHIHVLNDPQKAVQRAQLQELVKAIADEIKQCGSDLNYYSDRKLVSKLIKAKIYERRFAEHVETFAQRRSELQTTITAYISAGIDAANIAITHVGQKVEAMDKKIDSLLAVFQRLDTPSERELLKYIGDNGGAENCISRDDLLRALLMKSGQPTDSLAEVRKTLQTEISEDLDKVLSRNLNRFEKLLVVQNNNLERLSNQIEHQGYGLQDQSMKLDKLVNTSILILEEGKLIKKAVVPNASIKLKDPELQQIWDRMGLSGRRSVKAKQFVLTFRDYLITTDHSVSATPALRSGLALDSDAPSSLFTFPVPETQGSVTTVDTAESDAWVLKHINAAHVQPIIEAMDEDGSGFISVQEANKFALSRPKGMRLLHWIAYWAAGWHYNITDYRSKIYGIMQKLHKISSNVLAVNRKLAAMYLDDFDYFRIEGILRHISPLASDVARDPKLVEVSASILVAQEERLKKNLHELSYILGTPADVALVIGTGRLETWLLPLLYVLLERHLEVFKIAQSRTLLSWEFVDHCVSLGSIIFLYDERMRQLRDIFRPVNRDTETHFKNFAYGMFLDSYKWTGKRIAGGNTLLSYKDDIMNSVENDTGTADVPDDNTTLDTSILYYGSGGGISFQDLSDSSEESGPDLGGNDGATVGSEAKLDREHPPHDYVPHGIEGRWVGTFGDNLMPPFECIVQSTVDGKLVAKGRDYAEFFEISGWQFHDLTADVTFALLFPGYFPVKFKGSYDHSRDTIRGWWAVVMDQPGGITEQEDPPQTPNKTISMTRHSVNSFRFRKVLETGNGIPELSVAQRRWAFAIQTVLFGVQDKLGSWDFMRRRFVERDDWIELSIRHNPPDGIDITRGLIDDQQLVRWEEIRSTIHPSTLAVYYSVARFLQDRRLYDVGGVFCDVCKQDIIFQRYMCITCIEDDYSNRVDFCVDSNCSELQNTFSTTDLVHSPSHTILRCTERIYTYELPNIASQAQILSESVKKRFREQNSVKNQFHKVDMKTGKSNPASDNKAVVPHLTCSCCGIPLTLPCWACAICTPDLLLCLQCEKKLNTPLKPRGAIPDGHSRRHHLMRINDSVEAKAVKQRSQDKQLGDMETRINNGLRDLEHRIDTQHEERMSALEQKLDGRIASLETKIDSLMSLMHQVLQAGDQRKNN